MRTFPFSILTPSGLIVAGDVTQVQVRSHTGSLGVMARHAPMLVACPPGIVRIMQEGVWVGFRTDECLLAADGEKVTVLTPHAQYTGDA